MVIPQVIKIVKTDKMVMVVFKNCPLQPEEKEVHW